LTYFVVNDKADLTFFDQFYCAPFPQSSFQTFGGFKKVIYFCLKLVERANLCKDKLAARSNVV
jgi:hypothetical protein